MDELSTCVVKTPAGDIVLGEEKGRLAFCCFREHFSSEAKRFGFSPRTPIASAPKTPFLKSVKKKVERYFDGDLGALKGVARKSRGTDFQEKVWSELARIEPGSVKSYTQVAKRISRPGATRAVGTACGKNPFLLFVPCHRVIAADGRLGGFSAGLPRKVHLLAHEGLGECDCGAAH